MSAQRSGRLSQLREFFFADEIPYGLALVRILLPLVLLLVVVPRWPHARELFSTDGAAAPLALNYGRPGFPPPIPGAVAVAMTSTLVLFLVASCIGWHTRVSLIAATVLYTYLNLLDSLSSMTKYSVIASHVLFLLSLSHCGAIWSVDRWRQLRRGSTAGVAGEPSGPFADGTAVVPRFPAWPRRLMQILVGIIYFGAALTKMHTPAFFSGDQIRYWMLTNVNNSNPVGEYLSLFPAVVMSFSYTAIVWEVLFLFLCWKGFARVCMLGLGVVFHVMTALTLGLFLFPLVCCSTYCCFVDEQDVEGISRFWRRWQARIGLEGFRRRVAREPLHLSSPPIPYPSKAAYVFLTAMVIVGGIELEHWLDPYNERRAGGPPELVELDRELVQDMLGPTTRIREHDKLFSFDVGTILVGEYLVDRRYEFQHGDQLITQCSLNPPHEDMWVECNLHDAQDRVIDRVGQVVPRDTLRTSFLFQLTEALQPGQYFLVVKSRGLEIARRAVTLRAKPSAPVAN